jgi:GNAT superfamily N-acetyltransferase
LDLDSGYTSRLLRSLESHGFVETQSAVEDARVVRVSLTRKGKREVSVLDRRADEFAESLIAKLNPGQRKRLVSAMAEVERLMTLSAVHVQVEEPDSTDARCCLVEYFKELGERFESGFDPDNSISASANELRPPDGAFLIGRLDARAVACGALKIKTKRIAEIKRMWVAPDVRGLGVGRLVLAALETYAKDRGLKTLRLETNRVLAEAQGLYRTAGYTEVAPFNDEPYAHHWFEKRL